MATKKSTKSTTKSTTTRSTMSLLDQLGFWAVIFLAIVMFINAIILLLAKLDVEIKSLSTATGILNKIALAIAIGITIFCSYFAARRKNKNMFTLWLVCAILVGLSFILGIALI